MSVRTIMQQIKRIDLEPGIFKVFLMCAPHLSGYKAWVEFRTIKDAPEWISAAWASGDTPEEALNKLRKFLLMVNRKACPHCGKMVNAT